MALKSTRAKKKNNLEKKAGALFLPLSKLKIVANGVYGELYVAVETTEVPLAVINLIVY